MVNIFGWDVFKLFIISCLRVIFAFGRMMAKRWIRVDWVIFGFGCEERRVFPVRNWGVS